jgi:SAM-dependent methyltransferase
MSLPLFRFLGGDSNDGPLLAANLTKFSNADDHFYDPTCLDHDLEIKNPEKFESIEEAVVFLRKNLITCENAKAYKGFFNKKQSILDLERTGTFHQQLGQHLFFESRLSAETLWEDYKIDNATGEIQGALYKYVQDSFMEKYFSTMDLHGKVVLDFGCGNGMALRHLAKLGAEIIGIDPDKMRLAKAREWFGHAFTPVLMDLTLSDPLSVMPEKDFDFVWMSDVFLLYFYPVDGCAPGTKPVDLLKRLTHNLKPGGKCTFMEPHGCFWLAPWLGQDDMPFTVLTEYSRKVYSVAPGLEELAEVIAGAGLHISRIYEPKPAEECRAVDPKAYYFADNFPQWWVFELVKP